MQSTKPNFIKLLILLSAVLAALMGHPDTAQAQNGVAFSPSPVVFTSSLNASAILSRDVVVTVNGVPATTVSGVGTTGFVSAAPGANPGILTVIANPQGLQAGTYNAAVDVTANNQTARLPVTLTIFGSNTLTLSANNLRFDAAVNGAAPASQTVTVNGSVPGIPITVTTATSSGGNFLRVAQTGTAVPTSLVITADPTGLAAGTYTGTVTVAADQVQPQVITVNLYLSGQPILIVQPNPLTLLYQSGINAPAPTGSAQVLSTVAQIPYTGTVAYNTCGPFFTVNSGLSGTTNSQLTVTVNLAQVGTNLQCSGSITITAPDSSNKSVVLPINLQVSPMPLLGVSPTAAAFNYSIGGAAPAAQTFQVVSSNGSTPLNYSVSTNTNFLMVPAVPANGFTTPSNFTLALNPTVLAALNPGSYQGAVTITALGSGNSPVTIPVSLTISNNPLVTLSQNFVNFNYQTGTNIPTGQSVNLATTMGSLPFTISVPTTAGAPQFVAFSPVAGTATVTPTPLTINLIPSVVANFGPGTYQNFVQVAAGDGGQTLQVNLTVSGSPLVNVSPQQLTFNFAQNGATPPVQTLIVTSTNGSNLPVSFSSNQSFLLVNSNATTPGSASVSVVPGGLAPGTYTAQITVTSGIQVQTVPVTLTVTSGVTLTATPTPLTFTQAANGPAPAGQTVTVATTGNSPLGYSVTTATATGGNWLTVAGAVNGVLSGSGPGTFVVNVNGGTLTPGTYNGSVVITSVGSTTPSVTIPVNLTVTAQTLVAAPTSLSFSATLLGAAPDAKTINVTSTGIANATFTATAQSTGGTNFLSVTPASGTTPGTATVSVNPANLTAGTYTGTITLTATGGAPLVIPVTLTVGAQTSPLLSKIQNAASSVNGPVSPGEIVSLFGTNLGPVTGVSLALTPQGSVATNLGSVQVLFDGIPAPLTYVSALQINAVVPYEIFGRATTNVVVNYNGVNAAALQLNVAPAAPGLFTANGQGTGQAAVLNQNSSVNGAANAAVKGSTIVIYATGEGQTSPAGATGTIASETALKSPLGPVTVTIGGVPAAVAYAGSAPRLVSGVLQVNAVIPAGAPSGAAIPVVVSVGGISSQGNATIAVQ